MAKLDKYKMNLSVQGWNIYSYETLVAKIVGNELHKVPWKVNGMTSSPTTSKHINYAARELNLTVVDNE
tara:strand:+ start:358 stop:564 length:207 start_codon:yes stop_codon:yes gene_type:complete